MRPDGIFSPAREQLAAARAALGMTFQDLAKATGLGINTIRRAEANGIGSLTAVNAERLVSTLRAAGVTFLEPTDEGVGIRFHTTE